MFAPLAIGEKQPDEVHESRISGPLPAYRGRTIWFVEVKDYRVQDSSPKPANAVQLAKTVNLKLRCSLDGLKQVSAIEGDSRDRQFAAGAVAAHQSRVALHLEPPVHGIRLFPSSTQTANILQELRQFVRDIDPKPLVLRIGNTSHSGVPWTVRSSA